MLLRFSLTAAGALLLAASASAQSTAQILPVPNVKDAGTYHLATGTWTRGVQSQRGDYEVIYDNTCSGAWYTALEQQTFHDDGRIPSTSSPFTEQGAFGTANYANTSLVGTNDSYDIQQFQFAYCTGVAFPMDALVMFYECYTACSDATLISPTQALQITGLPGCSTPGVTIGCWIITIDLLGASQNFTMNGDCDGTWDGSAALDYMGYAYMQITPDPSATSGPILAGDPDGLLLDGPGTTGCCVGCGTVFWAGSQVPGTNTQGSGLNDGDQFEIDDHLGGFAFSFNGCYWFGGYSATAPHADMHMEIYGHADPGNPVTGTQYCDGKFSSGNPCPCANDNDGSGGAFAGCANSHTLGGAVLTGSGNPSVSTDTVLLAASGMEPSNTMLFLQAQNNLDGSGLFLGDGIRCAGGNLKRIKVKLTDATGAADSSPAVISARSAYFGDVLQPGDVRYYQAWGRDTLNPPCGLGVNNSMSSNGFMITWGA